MKNNPDLINQNINPIFEEIKELINISKNKVYSTINTEMLNLYWNIGKIIMEIQEGNERANYGDTVLEKLSEKLTNEFGRGFSSRNLRTMRKFYMLYPIWKTVPSKFRDAVTEILPERRKNIFHSLYKLHLPTEQELIEDVEEEKKNFNLNKEIYIII